MLDKLKDPKILRIGLISAGAVIVTAIAGSILLQDTLFRMSITPPSRFAAEPAPPRPDYTKPEAWALRPALPPPGGWETPWGIDIFFVHPTSAYGGAWNAAIDSADALKVLKESILPNHAGPLLQAGPVYAPLYRQASLHSEIDVGGEGDGALELAYDDVLRAFDQYVAADNRFRGILLVGVGQGGLHVQRLVKDRFQDEALKLRLAAAYVIDAALPAELPGKAIVQPVCAALDEIHCVVSWKTVLAGEDSQRFRDRSPVWTADGKIAASKGKALVCVNPMRWTIDSELSPRIDHRGAARAKGADDLEPAIMPKLVSARCNHGVLDVERPSAPDLQPDSNAGAQYRTPDYNLFYGDIVANVATRMRTLSAWLDDGSNARKPAEPLPPAQLLDDPIYRPNGEPERAQ